MRRQLNLIQCRTYRMTFLILVSTEMTVRPPRPPRPGDLADVCGLVEQRILPGERSPQNAAVSARGAGPPQASPPPYNTKSTPYKDLWPVVVFLVFDVVRIVIPPTFCYYRFMYDFPLFQQTPGNLF